jgi:hypothetical protein
MQDRRLVITVPGDKYKVLSAQARESVRSPEQQAAFIVRSWLARGEHAGRDEHQSAKARR